MPSTEPRIATTHELMLPYAANLVRMRAKGASHGQMISWLHTQGVMVNMGEFSSFWPYLAIQKQNPPQPPVPATQPVQQPVGAPQDTRPSTAQNSQAIPSLSVGPSCRSAVPADTAQAEPSPSVASGADHRLLRVSQTPAGVPDLHTMMDKYKRILDKQIDKVEADPDPDPEKLIIIDRMMRTVQGYDRAQERKEERKETFELKKAGHELNVKKAAATAERVAHAESGAPKAKDFDNTQHIKEMRHEMFKDEFTPEKMAEVDRMIVECDKKALAEGIKFVPYVPPGPWPPDTLPGSCGNPS